MSKLPPLPEGFEWDRLVHVPNKFPGIMWAGKQQYAMDVRPSYANEAFQLHMAAKGHGTWDSITQGFETYEEAWNAGYARLLMGVWE